MRIFLNQDCCQANRKLTPVVVKKPLEKLWVLDELVRLSKSRKLVVVFRVESAYLLIEGRRLESLDHAEQTVLHDHEVGTDKVLCMLCLQQPIALTYVISLHVFDNTVSLGVVFVMHFFCPYFDDAHFRVNNHEFIVCIEEDFWVLRAVYPGDLLFPLQVELK